VRYRAFCDECRRLGVTLEPGDHVLFVLPMPPSWSARKRAAHKGQPHTDRPDLSNLLKAAEDAVLPEDKGMWNYGSLTKLWGHEGAICIDRKESSGQ
jgi:hypothetical protein